MTQLSKTSKTLVYVLFLILLSSLVIASDSKEIISLSDALEAKEKTLKPSSELSQAEVSLEKTKASLYPNLSGSGRVTMQGTRGLQFSSNYTLAWNTPVGVNMQLRYIPKPANQENALNFSASTSLWPLMTNTSGLTKLESATKTLDRAERAEVQKRFNEELSVYQSYVKSQIQYEKLLKQEEELIQKLQELEVAKKEYEEGSISKVELEDKDIAYRNAYYQYRSSLLNFERTWQDLCESLELNKSSVPERVVYDSVNYPEFTWDLERDISRAIEVSTDVLKAKDSLDEAKKALDNNKFSFFESSLAFNVNLKELNQNSQPSWSINLNLGFNTNDIFFDFTTKDNNQKHLDAQKAYLDTIKRIEKEIIRMKEDWELVLYQTEIKEMNFQRAKSDLEVKRLQVEAGAIKESDYESAKKVAFERYLDFLDQMLNLNIATNKAMFATGQTDRLVIFN